MPCPCQGGSTSASLCVRDPAATCDLASSGADALVAAVAHRGFLALEADDFARKLIKGGAFIDVKAAYDAARLRAAGIGVWRL